MAARVDKQVLAKRLTSFTELCRRTGIRVTHQRTEVFRDVAGTEEHPDVESIYRRVRRRVPQISLDTVYRTLRLFEEKGLVSRVGYSGDRVRFDAKADPHHHFICTRCGRVWDFQSRELDAFRPPGSVSALGAVESVHIDLRGLCRACGVRGRR